MPTDVLTAARDRLAEIGLADRLLGALVAGDDPNRDGQLTDEAAAKAWQGVAGRLRGYEGGRYARRTDIGLADLHDRLLRLLDDVRAATDVDMPPLLHRYLAIRSAQKALTTMAGRGATDEVEFADLNLRIPVTLLLKSAGVISNIDEVWPSWRDFTRRNGYDDPPWAYPEGRPDELAETVANLRWLARGPARPWVPTLRQAAQAFSEQMRAEEARRLAAVGGRVAHMSPHSDSDAFAPRVRIGPRDPREEF